MPRQFSLLVFIIGVFLTACSGDRAPAITYSQDQINRGAQAFVTCGVCHAKEPNASTPAGPTLWRIYGAKAGQKENYTYSAALLEADLIWDAPTLDAYLENPNTALPGGKMLFPGISNNETRTDIIAYLSTLR
ncbi:MAG: c-type cytochrome [Pseudomonadota bacterium]